MKRPALIQIVSKCEHMVYVCAVELHGKHAVLRDDFDSNLQGELDPNIWYVKKLQFLWLSMV